MSVLAKLAAATPRRVTEKVCLDAALEDEWRRLQVELEEAAKKDASHGSLEMPATTEVVERMEAIRERMAGSEVSFAFDNIPWTERLELQVAHPPRPGHVVDALRGWNIETFTRALIQRCCTQITDEDGDTATEVPESVWSTLLGREEVPAVEDDEGNETEPAQPAIVGTLNYQQVNRLFAAALKVTDGDTAVPPSARFLLESQDSGASLEQPSPGRSPRSGSAAGSRRGSARSSATTKAGSTGS